MKTKRIVVCGSANIDLVSTVDALPSPGETIMGSDLMTYFGGKGANQAVAAARLGGEVWFIGRVGDDEFGKSYRRHLKHTEKVIVDGTLSVCEDRPTGTALILVDGSGENQIVVCPGANQSVSVFDISCKHKVIKTSAVLVLQLEIPVPTVRHAIRTANEYETPVILNASPIHDDLQLKGLKIDYLVVNMVEAERLSGLQCRDDSDLHKVTEVLHGLGAKRVIITRGHRSTVLSENLKGYELVPTYQAQPVDTVGAGDTFAGALAVAIAEGRDLTAGVLFANCAAALATQRLGAQASMPSRKEVATRQEMATHDTH